MLDSIQDADSHHLIAVVDGVHHAAFANPVSYVAHALVRARRDSSRRPFPVRAAPAQQQ